MMLASPATGKDVFKAAEADDYTKLRKLLRVKKKEIQSGVTVKPKVDVEWRNVDGRNALMNAATKGNADNVRVLLYCSANPNSRDKDGNTPLHMACESTSDVSGVISEFIAFHADLDARNRLGDTPLHRAAQLGKDGICMQLVQGGANSSLFNTNGLTCLDAAAIANRPVSCGALLAAAPKLRRSTRALFEAVRRNLADVAKALLEGGMAADAQEPDEAADTPLHVAARMGNESMIKLLLRHNADPNKVNGNRETSVDAAAGKPAIVELLENTHLVEKIAMPDTPDASAKRNSASVELPLLKTKWTWSNEAPQYHSTCAADHGVHCLLDNDPKTYMDMEMAHGAENFVIFDFGREFIISGFRLCGNASPHMVKDFRLFSAPSIDGPWALFKTYTAEQKGPDALGEQRGVNQDFKGMHERTRFLKMVIDTNYGSFHTCFNGVGFFGMDTALEGLLKEFGIERLLPDFIRLGVTQVADMWMLTDNDIKRLSAGDHKATGDVIAAMRAAEERENQLTWIDFAKAPVRQHLEGKRLPDFTVVADPGCRAEIELLFHGDPDVKGETRKFLTRDPSGGPSKAVFSGIILSPPGNYIIEARSVDDPQIFVHTAEPTTISFMMKDRGEVDDIFNEMNDLLRI